MAACGRKEQAERTIFQLLLQQITVVFDLIFAWLFSHKDSNLRYFLCICKVTSMVVQGLSRALFYSKNKKFALIHFRPTLPSYAPRKYQKISFFQRVWVGSGGTLVGNGLYKFHNFHLFVLEATSEICSAK